MPRDEVIKLATTQYNPITGKLGMDPSLAWCMEGRPLPREGFQDVHGSEQQQSYLPTMDIVEAVLQTAWRGPWTYEVRS